MTADWVPFAALAVFALFSVGVLKVGRRAGSRSRRAEQRREAARAATPPESLMDEWYEEWRSEQDAGVDEQTHEVEVVDHADVELELDDGVVDLMEALKKSVAEAKQKPKEERTTEELMEALRQSVAEAKERARRAREEEQSGGAA